MKLFSMLIALVFSFSAHAAGGFLWLEKLSHATHLPDHTITLIFTSIIFIVIGLVYRLRTKSIAGAIVPDNNISSRNIMEAIAEGFYNLSKSIMGDTATKKYFPLVIFYFLYIFVNNLIGLVPGFMPPTENLNTGLAFGAIVFAYYNWKGIQVQGIVGHIKHFMGPMLYLAPLIFVLEIISHAMRPLTLALRIRGNMMGDHAVLTIFTELVPYIVPIPFYVLGLFVCFMQAFVFTLLTIVYIGMAVETHDHEDH